MMKINKIALTKEIIDPYPKIKLSLLVHFNLIC